MPNDPVADYLKGLQASERVRAAAWDAVYTVKDDQQAQEWLTQLPLSDESRAVLWDARKGSAAPLPGDSATLEVLPDQPQAPEDSAASRFVGGAAQYLNPITIAGGLYGAVRHPIDTGSAALSQMGEQWSQAKDLASQGRYIEAGGHAAAGSLPFVGPAAAKTGERFASGDIAGGFGETAGLLGPALVAPVARGVTATTARAVRAVPGAADAVATGLESGAQSRVADVISPKVGANKARFGNQAQKVAPDLAKDIATEGAPMSRSGLAAQVETKLGEAEAALDAAADARGMSASVETQPILDALKAKRQALVAEAVDASDVRTQGRLGDSVEPAPNAPRIAALDKVIGEVEALGPTARYEAIRRIRQAWDQVAKVKYAPSVTADFLTKSGEASGAADATGALRQALADADPATAAANSRYSLYRTANDVLKAAEETERARPRVGRAIMARLTASLVGGQQAGMTGAVVGYAGGPLLDSLMNSGATTKLQTAALMQKLATAVRTGDISAVDSAIGKLRAAAKTARRGTVAQQATSPSGRQPETATTMP